MTTAPLNALTVDVEDYFHVAALAEAIDPKDWDRWPSRVERNTDALLELFERHGTRATFFVLGWVAERQPELVRRILRHGHEIASHGYSHQLVYHQTPDTFREETRRSKALLEDITGETIEGYRAASYSITNESRWALDILAEEGFTWDSSIFPVRHDRYGMPDAPEAPYRIETQHGRGLVEFPLSTARLFGYKLPIAGGGYFRLFPYAISRWGLKQVNRRGLPAIFYLHPWEIDPQQPRVSPLSWKSRFRHYNNLRRCYTRLDKLLSEFAFTDVSSTLAAFHDSFSAAQQCSRKNAVSSRSQAASLVE